MFQSLYCTTFNHDNGLICFLFFFFFFATLDNEDGLQLAEFRTNILDLIAYSSDDFHAY